MIGLREQIASVITNVAGPYQETPSVARRRQASVIAGLVIGAVLLGFSLTRTPGDASFYWLTFALAAVWAGGGVSVGSAAPGQHLLARAQPAAGAHRRSSSDCCSAACSWSAV